MILSDHTAECVACGRRVAVHTAWRRTAGGQYMITGWIVRHIRDGELVDELGDDLAEPVANPGERRRRRWRGVRALDTPPGVDLRPRID